MTMARAPGTLPPRKRPEKFGRRVRPGLLSVVRSMTPRSSVHPDVARPTPARATLPHGRRADDAEGAGAVESGPAIFAGVVFALFGGALLVWTGTRVRRHEPVAQGVNQVASATLAGAVGIVALGLGAYCLTRL
jgi:hypothetical protein